MTYYNHISVYLCIFICLFLEVKSFTPAGRYGHASVLVENKLYFFGGVTYASNSNEVFYLDLSQPFNLQIPPWNDLTSRAGIPFLSSWAAASLSVANDEKIIYLFGGVSQDLVTKEDYFKSMINSFNLNSLKWDVPVAKGKIPDRRRQIGSVIDDTGKMYMFSGGADNYIGSPTLQYFNDMVIFNTVELSWLDLTPPNAPVTQLGYSATLLLQNGSIVYIGGYSAKSANIDISQINIFNTKSLTWSNKVAKLIDPIDNRNGHTAVLAPNGKIIIYGGTVSSGIEALIQPAQVMAVLNTETEPFEWTVPLVSSNVVVPSLVYHTADLVDNYMIVAFGNITQPNGPSIINSKIYIMDIRNYTWVYTFEPSTPSNNSTPPDPSANPSTQPSNASESNNQLTTMKIVIATIGGIFGTAILMTIGFFGHRWYKKRQILKQNDVMRIYGNHGGNHGDHGIVIR